MATVDEADSIGLECSRTLAGLRQWIVGRHPAFTPGTCLTVRTVGGSSHDAIHATGRAIDIMLADSDKQVNVEAMWIVINVIAANAAALGVQRIMFDGRHWNATMPVGGVPIADGPSGWPLLPPAQSLRNQFKDHAHIEVDKAHMDTITYERIYATLQGPLEDKVAAAGNSLAAAAINQDRYVITAFSTWGSAEDAAADDATVDPLPVTDTSGKWTRDQILQATSASVGTDKSVVLTAVICGGTGGYAVNQTTGVVAAVGTAPLYGMFSAPVLSFIVYGNGYYGLLNDGLTIQGFGPDASVTPTFSTCLYSGPWDTLTSPVSGTLVVSRTGDRLNVAQCAGSAYDYALNSTAGPCC